MNDRRQNVRQPMHCPVKVRSSVTGRYLAGVMHNMSPGGALVTIDHPSRLTPGDRITLAMTTHPRAALLHADEMTAAVVVRNLFLDERQHVAIRFEQAVNSEPAAQAA